MGHSGEETKKQDTCGPRKDWAKHPSTASSTGKVCSVSTLVMDVLWEGKKGGAVHFTSFGWAKCKYQWEIFSSNCSWRGEERSAGGLFVYTGRSFRFPRALASLCLHTLTEWVTRGGLPSERSPCTARSADWRVPKAKECFWCLTPLVTDAREPSLAYQAGEGSFSPFKVQMNCYNGRYSLHFSQLSPLLRFWLACEHICLEWISGWRKSGERRGAPALNLNFPHEQLCRPSCASAGSGISRCTRTGLGVLLS